MSAEELSIEEINLLTRSAGYNKANADECGISSYTTKGYDIYDAKKKL
jgi:hypothetical protein